jgi:hypothetical protein
MSQLNVDSLRHSSGSGSGIDLQSTGNVAIDTNTLYVDSVNDRVGVNASIPNATLDVNGDDGLNINTAPITEKFNTISGSSNGNTSVDVLLSNIHLYTSANTGNWTPNIRGNSSTTLDSLMATNQVCLVTLISQNGGSSGYISAVNIDGSGRTVEWLDGEAPDDHGGDDGYDIYQFSIIKNGSNSFLVFGNQTYCSN